MIISHKHKYIFIKVSKAAGTSAEIALSKYCGPDDIITPVSAIDEEKRVEFGGVGPQNFELKKIGRVRALLHGRRGSRFRNHVSASDVRSHVGEGIWKTYFKFCVERNPWDRVVSSYFWKMQRQDDPMPFADFIRSEMIYSLKRNGYENYTVGGDIIVDRVLKFEDLQTEMNDVAGELGICKSLPLPFTKHRTRPAGRDYRDYYDDDDAKCVANIFENEIEHFGYTF